nr:hypothetical protein [Tanacetum cinerariifolium]
MAEGEIYNLTMDQYLALTRRNQAPGMVKPEIGGNVKFEIKSQFMQKLREDTFSRGKNDDAHEHVERVLDIVILFNIPGVPHDAVMLRVFPITLSGAAKSHQKVNIFYNGLVIMNHQLLDSQGPIPGMTLAQALTAIQTMADQSQKWHDGSSIKNMYSGNSEGIAAIAIKLDSIGFSDKEEQKAKKAKEVVTTNIATNIKQVTQEEKKMVSHYVEPYEPPISFLKRMEQYAEEALVHKTMDISYVSRNKVQEVLFSPVLLEVIGLLFHHS